MFSWYFGGSVDYFESTIDNHVLTAKLSRPLTQKSFWLTAGLFEITLAFFSTRLLGGKHQGTDAG